MVLTPIDAWRLLRMPFCLSSLCVGHHTCKWEIIDIDAAGCVICGSVHECSKQTCMDVVHTDDAVVCTVTGVCVVTKQFSHCEYSDTVAVFSNTTDVVDVIETRMGRVKTSVCELLTSDVARKVFLFEHSKRVSKFNTNVSRLVRSGEANLVQVLQGWLSMSAQHVFDEQMREGFVTVCVNIIQRVIGIAQVRFGLVIKDSELRTFVFGMVYLMCRGVQMHNVQILPRIIGLREVLPSENNVVRFFHFRSRHITETENKFKFLFRNASVEKLQEMF